MGRNPTEHQETGMHPAAFSTFSCSHFPPRLNNLNQLQASLPLLQPEQAYPK